MRAVGRLIFGAMILAACSNPAPEPASASAAYERVQSIPLKPGYYVTTDTACGQASNATVSLFKGDGFSAWCETQSIDRVGPQTYRLVQSCSDPREPQPYEMETVYELKGDSAYVEKGEGWSREARFCPQSQMPDPFDTNDISEFLSR